ncbi:hypothetical protein GO730_21860 [Spirosoma sp. HMF3257]|uniref:Cadherin domain-containing protein n=1 Tax=Spirosoma telluris TaxID=2183553 RepID=A0A327NTT2_9BACT|nr:hypothetical protein [Spirosoma telluris]RAI76158.1 hypothetical protein HMF3257_21785 [Spirosoma telluris]
MIDSDLTGTGAAAIINGATGQMLVRNVSTMGYGQALADPTYPVTANAISEWTSDAPVSQFPAVSLKSLNLPIKETPIIPWDAPETWVNVEDAPFGATPDGICNSVVAGFPCDDDGPAIQRAIDATLPGGSRAGATTLFLPSQYRLLSTVYLRGSIRRIIGLGRTTGPPYAGGVPTSFVVQAGASPIILYENLGYGESSGGRVGPGVVQVDNQTSRTLVFRKCGMGTLQLSGGGEVYFESVSGFQDALFTFNNVAVWARQLNPERHGDKVFINGGKSWMLGLKTEKFGQIITASNGAKVEVLGGLVYSLDDSRVSPMFVINDSDVSYTFNEYTGRYGIPYPELVKETQTSVTKTLLRGAPAVPYPSSIQPPPVPAYPATWSQRNDGTVPDGIDGVVGSSLVLYASSRGENKAPSFALSTTEVVTNEDAGPQLIPGVAIQMNDENDERVQELAFTVTTTNPTLFAVSPTLDAQTGTLTYTPATDAFGTATVTVILSDDGSGELPSRNTSLPQTFTIRVEPVNDAPTLNTIPDAQVAAQGFPLTVSLSGLSSGKLNETQSLTILAVSSNPSLVPNPVVAYSPGSTTATLTMTPTAGQSGVVTITVSVQDDGGTANSGVNMLSRVFSVTLVVVTAPVRPVLECVALNGDGSYTARFGYKNDNAVSVIIPAGTANYFVPNAGLTGLIDPPTLFLPGRQQNTFQIQFNGNALTWLLKGPDNQTRTSTASSTSTRCAGSGRLPASDENRPKNQKLSFFTQIRALTR